MLTTRADALAAIDRAWPIVCDECLSVLGSELHYQAMIYHALRRAGVPVNQLGMNVKQWIDTPQSELFKRLDARKHEVYRGGFEPIPDVVIFSPEVQGDWRRRQRKQTLGCMLAMIEVKASERADSRLSYAEIARDIRKLAAHREEVEHLGCDVDPVMMVIDSAPVADERMVPSRAADARRLAQELRVEWRYISPTDRHADRPGR